MGKRGNFFLRACLSSNGSQGRETLLSLNVSSDVPRPYIECDFQLALDGLCEECFDIVLNERCKNANAGERERKYIEAEFDSKHYLSTGQHDDFNNGYPW